MRLKHKIFFIISVSSLISTLLIGLYAINSGKKVIESKVFEKLTAIRELKANQIENYFQQIEDQLSIFSEDLMVVDAMKSFEQAFDLIDSEFEINSTKVNESLLHYYNDEFFPRLSQNSTGLDYDSTKYLGEYRTQLLQYLYISNNKYEVGEKHNLIDFELPITYNFVHRQYHPKFKDYLEKFGFYDIFLVDPQGNIVYTVYKEVDFATSLLNGPYQKTNLAKIFSEAENSMRPGEVSLIDFAPYPPSYNSHASFMASPIFEHDKVIGLLIFQLPIGAINNIMTDNKQWENVGLGTSGETYLVGEDFKLRNQSRFLIEDKDNYLRMLKRVGVAEDIIDRINNLNNSIGLQTVQTEGVKAALTGESDTKVFNDYRGIPVLSSYKKLKLKGLSWVIMSEIDKKEAFAEIDTFVKYIVLAMCGIALLIVIISITFSKSLTRPLNYLIEITREMAGGNLKVRSRSTRQDEIGILSNSFDLMANSINELVIELEEHKQNLEQKVQERTNDLENALKKIELIINNSADIIITIDKNHEITQFNHSAEKVFGYTLDEVVGKPLTILLPEKSRAVHSAEVNNFRDASEVSRPMDSRREIAGIRKDGSVFPMEATISKNEIDGYIFFTAFARDISERLAAEKIIKKQKDLMENTIESLAHPFYVVDANDYSLKLANTAAKNLSKTELTTCYALTHKRDTPCNSKEDPCPLVEIKRTKEPVIVEHKHFDKEGNITFAEVHGHPVFDEAGEVIQMIEYSLDITERKKMEADLEKAFNIIRDQKERMEEELNTAHDIQMSMLPLYFSSSDQNDNVDFFGLLEAAREVGGDFFNHFFIDRDHLCFLVGDVSGKGVPAALLMSVTQALLKSESHDNFSTAKIVAHVNSEISKDNVSYMFVTLFIGILDMTTGVLTYTNAGHNPTLVKRSNGNVEKLSTLHGPVLGAAEDYEYRESQLKINSKDFILAYTDGVTEANNNEGELYSDNRLANLMDSFAGNTCEELVNDVLIDVRKHEGGAEQFDDITILAVNLK